jgi:hypothetical protein
VFTDSIIRTMIINPMMVSVSTSETSVHFYQTTGRNIPEDSHLHTRRHENLKSDLLLIITPAACSSLERHGRELHKQRWLLLFTGLYFFWNYHNTPSEGNEWAAVKAQHISRLVTPPARMQVYRKTNQIHRKEDMIIFTYYIVLV